MAYQITTREPFGLKISAIWVIPLFSYVLQKSIGITRPDREFIWWIALPSIFLFWALISFRIKKTKPEEISKTRCPKCGSAELPTSSPRTFYVCGSSDYDQRPGTFHQSKLCQEAT